MVPVPEGGLAPAAARGAASATGFFGRAGESCDCLATQPRILLIGLGDQSAQAGRAAGAVAVARLAGVAHAGFDLRGLAFGLVAEIVTGACLRANQPAHELHRPEPNETLLSTLDLIVDDPVAMEGPWTQADAGLRGNWLARELVVEPSNRLTPSKFASRLKRLERHGITVEVWRSGDLRREGFGGVLAVGRGSAERPRVVFLRWEGEGSASPVVLVGKGVTFDTGGICVKPADKMWEMRADMAGAAACAGAILAAALRSSPASIVAVLPLAENATGAESYRPSDVLRMRGGTTVEVVDTDAEGRLILADALAYATEVLKPRAVIDIATLTGSNVIALGGQRAGLFGNDEPLLAALEQAAEASGEAVWRMPIGPRHRSDLDSDIADLRHCVPGRMQPDASHAAAFLREFVGDVPWAHLDMAGLELRDEADDQHGAGATGFGARLLDRLIATHFEP